MESKGKIRADQLAVERGLFSSRSKAQAAIIAGEIFSNEELISKPGHQLKPDTPLTYKTKSQRYVGRGGYKMEGALKEFHLDVTDAGCLDVGSSTGGFTDCLLQSGAKQVSCVDVGKGQLDFKLRTDARVTVREGVNARYLREEDFACKFDLAVVDVSFISLTKILPAISPLLNPRTGKILALIKPQFEVGPKAIGRGGIVRDKAAREMAVQHILDCLPGCGLKKIGVKPSCLKGMDGNEEFFVLAEKI